jgi:predicted site-specific integrase-resolvase
MSIKIHDEEYFTAQELSDKFQVSMETIRRWRKKGGLKGKLVGVRRYFYKESDIEAYLNQGEENDKNNTAEG